MKAYCTPISLRLNPKSRPCKPGMAEGSTIKLSDYVLKDGVRLVKPYFFDFRAMVKQRWQGRSMLDVFLSEFPARELPYYEAAYADGRLRVTGRHASTGLHDPLKNGMQIMHYIHRHEPPVLDTHIPILGQTDELVAVGKAASMPVHVSGQYRKNTLQQIVQTEHPELGTLFPVHRLDKSVSGVLLFARSSKAADEMRQLIMDQGKVQKMYVARVLGEFPETRQVVKAALCWDAKYNHVTAVEEGKTTNEAGLDAKPSHTEFERICVAPDGKTSLVRCWPLTGRTHQIRVHLQTLGYPIANDVQYGGTYLGPRPPFLIPGTKAAQRLETERDQGSRHKRQKLEAAVSVQPEENGGKTLSDPGAMGGGTDGAQECRQLDESGDLAVADQFAWLTQLEVLGEDNDTHCQNCPKWVANQILDLRPMWLHAQEYKSSEWCFTCPLPQWADVEWTPAS